MRNPGERKKSGPGVPEAIPRGLQNLLHRYGGERLDRVWIFPPLVSGRRESGLLVASVFVDGSDTERRVLVSSPYSGERTGKGLRLDWTLREQGEAPADRFPRVVEGVVRRAEKDLGEPEELVVEGDEETILEALSGYPAELLDPELPPLGPVDPGGKEGAGEAEEPESGSEAAVSVEAEGVEEERLAASADPVAVTLAGEAP